MDFNVLHVKTPQLIGIILGCTVFIITISVVFYLLYASGSLSKLFNELQSTQSTSSTISKQTDINIISTQFLNQPQLYDELIHARNKLSTTLDISLQGINIILRSINLLCDNDILSLMEISNGSALFGESSYHTDRLWGWFHNEYKCSKSHVYKYIKCPSNSIDDFRNIFYNINENNSNVTHLLIKEKILDKVIGMLSLVNNQPKYLSIQIDNIWITPAFQGKRRSHEAMYLIIKYLIKLGYRRIFVEIDERHIIGRKYLERCGFLLEGILRKHKIIQNRNSNTAIYVVLNSDWIEIEIKLKKYLNINHNFKESKKLVHIGNISTTKIQSKKQNLSSQNKINQNKKNSKKKK